MKLNGAYHSLLCTVLLSTSRISALLIHSFADLPNKVSYDFLVVGGGTAGNAITSFLVKNPKVNVLVLEAGPSGIGDLKLQVPFFAPDLLANGPYNWNYSTVPQKELHGRNLSAARGFVLGGCSSINWLVYTRGSAEDWDRISEVTGDEKWGWNCMLDHFKESERWTAPADNHNTSGQYNPEVHGYNGNISVSLSGYPRSVDSRIIDAANQLGGPYAFNLDVNSGYPLGVGYEQSTISGGLRSSSVTGYLQPVLDLPNLHVLVNAQVSRLLQSPGFQNDQNPAFRAVEFKDSTGTLRVVNASREVILAAGTINTPQILLNSGIGNKSELESVGVKSLVDLPDVGKNLSEHPVVPNAFLVNDNMTIDTIRRNFSQLALEEWKANKTGPYTNTMMDRIMFGRVPFNITGPDPAAGFLTPHFEIGLVNGLPVHVPELTGNYFTMNAYTISVQSRGSLKIASSDMFAPPLYDPALYSDSSGVDLLIMREAIRYAQKFLTAPAFHGYISNPPEGLKDNMCDEELNAYIRNATGVLNHPVGTASMSPKGATWGVTDPDLKLKKVAGVMIVDASVLTHLLTGHISAAVYGVAHRGIQIITDAYPDLYH